MKKVLILATMFAAVTITSCGGNKNEEGEKTDSTATATEPTTEEPTTPAADTTTAPAADTAAAETPAK